MNQSAARALGALCLASLLLSSIPSVLASTTVLEWTEVDVPGDNDFTIVTPSEVTSIAAGDNGTVYAIDAENGRLYRSDNYSVDWQDITKYLDRAGATLPATLIAVAPDNEGLVAVLADGGARLYASLDFGLEWERIALPSLAAGEEVTCLAISGVYREGGDEYREIAIGTASWGDGLSNGAVWVLQGGCRWVCWENQELTVDTDDPVHIGADVAALAYSSRYSTDHTLVVVCSTGSEAELDAGLENRTFLCLGERDVDDGGTDWGFLSPDYPLELLDVGDDGVITYLRAMLALPSNYSSGDEETRSLFVSLEREPDYLDDVYRVVEDELDPLSDGRMDVDGGSDIDIWSLAYKGDLEDGMLLAGEREPTAPGELNTQVWRCEDPWKASPDWDAATVPPTGPGYAYVVWAPDVSLAYCGTSSRPGTPLDESAFSASTYGDLWRQMAIIDTEFVLTDILVTPDGEDLYLTTSNPWGPESVWQSYTEPLGKRWVRVLTVDSDSGAVMLAISPEYDEDRTLYVAEHNGDQLAVSRDAGDSWEWQRTSPEPLLDLVVVDTRTLFAVIPGGRIMKTTYSGKVWDDPVDTLLDEVNMLARASDGTLLAGGDDGRVSYSTDDGASFTLIEEPVGDGAVQVMPDVAYADNGWLYVGTSGADEGLWRWRIGVSDYWQQLDNDITQLGDGQRIGGLLMGEEGTLYPLRTEPADDDAGGMTRWLCPACEPCVDFEYDHVVAGLPDGAEFEAADAFITAYPVGTLWGNDEFNDIFVIDSGEEQRIFLYRDTLCKRGPFLDSPVDGAHVDDNACDCNRDAVVTFDWEDVDEVDLYEVGFYLNADTGTWLWTEQSDYNGYVASPVGSDTTEFQSGSTYGWRVRTVTPILSPWSDMWVLYPQLLQVSELQPAPGQTDVATRPIFTWNGPGMAAAYEFTLATDPEFTNAVASFTGSAALEITAWSCDRELSPGTNYFWRVRTVSGDACSPWVESSFTTASSELAAAPTTVAPIDIPAQQSSVSDYLIWTVFGLVALLMAGIIVLVLRTARR